MREPELESPVLVASWPGIGNIGVMAVDTLRDSLGAEEFAEIEPWDFFYPRKVLIRGGELIDLEFPASKFYFKRTERRDLLLFIGEEQPAGGGKAYAEGMKAYQMANLVLDVAVKFGCRRVYTSGAAVAPMHHTARPRVWAVPNSRALLDEVRSYQNTVLMPSAGARGGQGSITGLNGLLLGAAAKRGLEGICVMGEIPVYLQGFPFPYPKASQSVLEVLTRALDVRIDMSGFAGLVERAERQIDGLYAQFPAEVRDQLDKLKYVTYAPPAEAGPITEEDKQKILEDIDKFFKKEPRGD